MGTKEKPTTLECAAETLQAAHDYIEANGFDIEQYEPDQYYSSGAYEQITEENKNCGACCYIGTVRFIGGLTPNPDDSHRYNRAVTAALRAMDRVARNEPDGKKAIKNKTDARAGRVVEALGFEAKHQGMTGDEQRDYALTILRKALTEIHRTEEVHNG